MANMEPQEISAASSQSRAGKLAALRDDLDHRIDEIVKAGPDRMSTLKKEFDAVWKEFKHELEPH